MFESLVVIAEFSIGLAGFAGIVAAFDRALVRSDPVTRFRFVVLMFMAFLPGFLSLITVAILQLGYELLEALRVTSGLAAFVILVFLFFIRRIQPPGLPMPMLVFMFGATIINGLIFACISFLAPEISSGLFLVALVITLFQAALVFAVTVLLGGSRQESSG